MAEVGRGGRVGVGLAGRVAGRRASWPGLLHWLACLLLALPGQASAAEEALVPASAASVPIDVAVDGQSCQQRDGDLSRPRVGLALGGGGARGIAHVGVLRKLEQMGIPVDCVAGTSMGSLVGGFYAAGMDLDAMEKLVLEADWKQLFDDSIQRRERTWRRKFDDRTGLATVGVGMREGQWSLSPGVLQGQRIQALIERSTAAVSTVSDFDRLPIPFRAVATDINNGEAVELRGGSLAAAMRASMSLPGIFQPIQIDGRVLVDGGIAQQVPVATVRRMGAQVVIAVDVGTPLESLDADASLVEVMYQLTGLLTVGNTRQSTESLGPADVLVVPALGVEVGTGDFDKAADALRIGRAAADEAEPQLATLPRWRGSAPVREAGDGRPVVEFVRLENDSDYDDAVITAMVDVPLGRPLDLDRLERSTLRVYSLGTFANVSHELVEEGGRTGVLVRAREKAQGPNYLQLGYRIQTDYDGTYDSSLRVAMLHAPVTALGAEARVALDIGSEPGLRAEYYHPFDPQARWYFQGSGGIWSDNLPLFDDAGHRIATYDAQMGSLRLALGRTFDRYGAIELGIERSDGKASVEVGDAGMPEVELSSGVWSLTGLVDRLDSLYFPREGWSASLGYRSTADWLGGEARFETARMELLAAHSFGRGAVQASLAWSSTLSGTLPLHERFAMGGRGNLVGFHYNELTGQQAAVLMLGYSWQLAQVFGRSAVVGTTLEYGNAWERRADMRWDDGVANGSVYVGFDSWIGPMLFGWGLREGGNDLIFLEIGQPF